MPGLLDTQPQAAGPHATPEMQQMYNQFVLNCIKLIGTPPVMKQILQALRANQDPIDALAQAAVMVVIRVEDSAEKSGVKIDGAVLLHGGAEIVGALAKIAERAKVHTYDQKEVDAALVRAADMYRLTRQKQGKLDPAPFKQDMARLQQASQDGTLYQQFPHMAQLAERGSKSEKAGPGSKPGGMMGSAPASKKKARRAMRRKKEAAKRRGMVPMMESSNV